MAVIYYIPAATVAVLIVLRKYIESKWGRCKNNNKLEGKVAIITGANSGIGYEIAKELARRNATVILACRNSTFAKEAANKINKSLGCSNALIWMVLDLSSLQSIENFVREFKTQHTKLDLLINNAGVSYSNTKRVLTSDGVEIHFGVNHLGHFYLTNMLKEMMSDASRIIIMSSSLFERGEIYLNDLNYLKVHEKSNLYANSKLANIYFCKELAKHVEESKIGVYALCPGWVYTGLFRHWTKWYHYFLVPPIAFFFMRSPKQGCQTAIYCATEPKSNLKSGTIYRDCAEYKPKKLLDPEIGTQLWKKSEEMVKMIQIKQSSKDV